MKNYETLDAIVVIVSLLTVIFVLAVLAFIQIPQSQLPIISGLCGTVLGVVLTYASFRFQIPKKTSEAAPGTVNASVSMTSMPADPAPADGDAK